MLTLIKPSIICNGCGKFINYGNSFIVGTRVVQKFYFHDDTCFKEFNLDIDFCAVVLPSDQDYDYYCWSY